MCKVSYSPLAFGYILWKVRSIMSHEKLHLRRYGDCSKVRYSHLAFGYILWKVRSIMSHEELHLRRYGVLIRLVHSPCFWLHSVADEEHHEPRRVESEEV